MPIGRRYELMGWAASNDSYIIEDDYDSELRYFSKPIPALKSLENSSRVIYLGSFSSTLFAAVKISYMVLPEEMARLFSSMAQDYSQTCSKLEQLTLAMFMESGHYQTHIKKLRKLYSQKLSAVTDTFAEEASDFVTVKNTSSGISVILNVKSRKTTEELKKDAEQLGIPAVPHPKEGLLALYYNQIPASGDPSPLPNSHRKVAKLMKYHMLLRAPEYPGFLSIPLHRQLPYPQRSPAARFAASGAYAFSATILLR